MEQQILNYQIERLLGEGGMSRVYLGIDLKTGQKVAIKELLAHLANHGRTNVLTIFFWAKR
jgi:eukaryotic-like serine/threonine-protein kinase